MKRYYGEDEELQPCHKKVRSVGLVCVKNAPAGTTIYNWKEKSEYDLSKSKFFVFNFNVKGQGDGEAWCLADSEEAFVKSLNKRYEWDPDKVPALDYNEPDVQDFLKLFQGKNKPGDIEQYTDMYTTITTKKVAGWCRPAEEGEQVVQSWGTLTAEKGSYAIYSDLNNMNDYYFITGPDFENTWEMGPLAESYSSLKRRMRENRFLRGKKKFLSMR